MNKFFSAVSSVLEVPSVDASTRFRETEGWCSLHGFGLLVMMENDWLAPLPLDKFLAMESVGELYRFAFTALAARLMGVAQEVFDDENVGYGTIQQWDSVNHIRLAMEAEKLFGVDYPLEKIPLMRTIRDFLE